MNKTCLFFYFIVFVSCNRNSTAAVQENKTYSVNTKFQIEGTSNEIDSMHIFRPLTRKILMRPNFASFAGDNPFKIAYNVCVNREGKLTYIKLASADGISDKETIKQITKKIFELRFQPDTAAPRKECGTYTLKISAVEYKLR